MDRSGLGGVRVAVVGGDARQAAVAEGLASLGALVNAAGVKPRPGKRIFNDERILDDTRFPDDAQTIDDARIIGSTRIRVVPSLAEAIRGTDALVGPMAEIREDGYLGPEGEPGPDRKLGPRKLESEWKLGLHRMPGPDRKPGPDRRLESVGTEQGREFSLTQPAVIELIQPGYLVFAGRLAPSLQQVLSARGALLHELFDHEELPVLNSIPSAEGALQLAMELSGITVHGSKCLVLGFGRLGTTLGVKLAALAALVTVAAARREELARARALGLRALPLGEIAGRVALYDFIFNTIPAVVVGKDAVSRLDPESVLIDLASAPGGFDLSAAAACSLQVHAAPGLPAKSAPTTAGRLVAEVVGRTIAEELAARRST
ncbi:MAG: hypothetical protein HYY09_08905 [Firmicutes bacterium]|nr:hypothetical protein [Bacillota bacterium]